MSKLLSRNIMREPYYYLEIDGVALSEKLKKYITQVEFEDSDSEANLARIYINDSSGYFSNNLNLSETVSLKLTMGHKLHNRKMIDGEITHIEADYDAEGNYNIVIGAIDKTNKMTYDKQNIVWSNILASDIVKTIAKKYGFYCKVSRTSELLEQVTQEDETDAELVQRLAESEAYIWYYVEDTNVLYFGERIGQHPQIEDTLYYNMGDYTIDSFSPTLVEKNKEVNIDIENSDISEETGDSISVDSDNTNNTLPSSISGFYISGKTGKITEGLPRRNTNTDIINSIKSLNIMRYNKNY